MKTIQKIHARAAGWLLGMSMISSCANYTPAPCYINYVTRQKIDKQRLLYVRKSTHKITINKNPNKKKDQQEHHLKRYKEPHHILF
jgi:hypothetical protein